MHSTSPCRPCPAIPSAPSGHAPCRSCRWSPCRCQVSNIRYVLPCHSLPSQRLSIPWSSSPPVLRHHSDRSPPRHQGRSSYEHDSNCRRSHHIYRYARRRDSPSQCARSSSPLPSCHSCKPRHRRHPPLGLSGQHG